MKGISPDQAILHPQEIQSLVKKLAQAINEDYQQKELVVLGVLKGAFLFMADLIRELTLPLSCEFMRVSSYDTTGQSGPLRLDFDLTQPVSGKHVLVLEDVVDTGQTLRFIRAHLENKGANSVKTCALIQKAGSCLEPPVDFLGKTVPEGYIIGYGMDLGGMYRNLPWIQLKP